jgi:hypothetical protein
LMSSRCAHGCRRAERADGGGVTEETNETRRACSQQGAARDVHRGGVDEHQHSSTTLRTWSVDGTDEQ